MKKFSKSSQKIESYKKFKKPNPTLFHNECFYQTGIFLTIKPSKAFEIQLASEQILRSGNKADNL